MKRTIAQGVLALMLTATAAQAQTFPDRPVRFIVPNPAGGSNDGAARALGQALGEIWPHGAVIENRAGAGGNYRYAICGGLYGRRLHAFADIARSADSLILLCTKNCHLSQRRTLSRSLSFQLCR